MAITLTFTETKIEITAHDNRRNLTLTYHADMKHTHMECYNFHDISKGLILSEEFKVLDIDVIRKLTRAFHSLKYYSHDFKLSDLGHVIREWFIKNILIDTSMLNEIDIEVLQIYAKDSIKKLKKKMHSTRIDKSEYLSHTYTPLKNATFHQLIKEYESREEYKSVDNIQTASSEELDFEDDILSKDFNKEAPLQDDKHLNDDFDFDEFDDKPEIATPSEPTENFKPLSEQASKFRANIKGSALENARRSTNRKE